MACNQISFHEHVVKLDGVDVQPEVGADGVGDVQRRGCSFQINDGVGHGHGVQQGEFSCSRLGQLTKVASEFVDVERAKRQRHHHAVRRSHRWKGVLLT